MSGNRQQNQHSQGRSNANTNSGNFANMDESKHREISSKGADRPTLQIQEAGINGAHTNRIL